MDCLSNISFACQVAGFSGISLFPLQVCRKQFPALNCFYCKLEYHPVKYALYKAFNLAFSPVSG